MALAEDGQNPHDLGTLRSVTSANASMSSIESVVLTAEHRIGSVR